MAGTGFRTMKLCETSIRLKRFEASEKARKVAELEHMIREFEGMANGLEREVKAEEERTGVNDPDHFAYSTFARSAIHRRENLRASVSGLMAKLMTRRGEVIARVDTRGRNRPPEGLVFIPFFDAGRLVNKLTLDATDPLSKETDYKKCAVKITKA